MLPETAGKASTSNVVSLLICIMLPWASHLRGDSAVESKLSLTHIPDTKKDLGPFFTRPHERRPSLSVDKHNSRDTCYLTLPRDAPLNYKRLKSGLRAASPLTTQRIGTKINPLLSAAGPGIILPAANPRRQMWTTTLSKVPYLVLRNCIS